jgi:hypothetical protein
MTIRMNGYGKSTVKEPARERMAIEEKEIAFLKSFAGLVERLCKNQYDRESQAVQS